MAYKLLMQKYARLISYGVCVFDGFRTFAYAHSTYMTYLHKRLYTLLNEPMQLLGLVG